MSPFRWAETLHLDQNFRLAKGSVKSINFLHKSMYLDRTLSQQIVSAKVLSQKVKSPNVSE